jgi:hypothetical protein
MYRCSWPMRRKSYFLPAGTMIIYVKIEKLRHEYKGDL